LGPVLVNYIREYQLAAGLPPAQAYNVTMYILAGLLAVGLICNLLVRPVSEKHYMKEEHSGEKVTPKISMASPKPVGVYKSSLLSVTAAWVAVGIPLIYGLWNTVQQTMALFR
ncbi:MAG TPA: hypothetical protein VIH14_06220, partial [Anaerolineales bacterium]